MHLDNYLIDKFQDLYNVIWDHFGITKGSIMMFIKFCLAFMIFLDPGTGLGWRVFWCLFFVFTAYGSYKNSHIPQSKGQYKQINKNALECRSGYTAKGRFYVTYPILLMFSIYYIKNQQYNLAVLFFIITISGYITTIIIRDREPTESFFSYKGV